jgi:DNA polymerase III sliding clamp (beta) subunit (PCNA family)
MKITIRQNVLKTAIDKGSIAALSEMSQSDNSNVSLLIKSVKITVDSEKFTVESSSYLMAAKYSIGATQENGIEVKEEGCVLVPAKEFVDWVKIQGTDATINMALLKLDAPQVVSSNDDEENSVKRIGFVKFTSRDNSKTGGKWELDCYDPSSVKPVDFSSGVKNCFTIKAQDFAAIIPKVSFAVSKLDDEHVIDHVSIQNCNNALYFLASDLKRCAVYKANILTLEGKKPLLLSPLVLEQVAKVSEKDNTLEFSYSPETNKIFIKQPNLDIRLTSPEKERITKFSNVEMLLQKQYNPLAEIPRLSLHKMLISVSIVNGFTALFSFKKSDNLLAIKAISEDGKYKPAICKSKIDNLTDDIIAVFGVTHILEGLKIFKDDKVQLNIPANKRSLKITSANEPNFQYFVMSIKNQTYENNASVEE